MTCPLHGSRFSVERRRTSVGPNGDPPARTPDLVDIDVKVEGDNVVRA